MVQSDLDKEAKSHYAYAHYMRMKIALPQAARLRIFFEKTVLLHICEGPELRTHYW